MKDKKECKLSNSLKGMGCEMKFAYILIVISLLMNIFVIARMGGKSAKKGPKHSNIAEWVEKNPEAILTSVNNYVMEKQQELQTARDQQAGENVKNMIDKIHDTRGAGVVNPNGKFTIVEYFDYNCGYCKQASKVVERLANDRKDIRVIYKELPILGEASTYAARVAVAVSMAVPNKYAEFHNAMMAGSARTEAGVKEALKVAGIKVETIEKTLKAKADEIENVLDSNMNVAQQVGINGTPAFVIEDELVPGALDYDSLVQMIDSKKK